MDQQRREALQAILDQLADCYWDLNTVLEEEDNANYADAIEEYRDAVSDICDAIDKLIKCNQ